MKKIGIIALLLTHIPLYPLTLTETDKAIIVVLTIETPTIASGALWFSGSKLGSWMVPITPTPTAEDYIAREAQIRADPMLPIRILGAYLVMPLVLGIAGWKQAKKWGNKVAAFYIAQKYKIPFKEALEATNKYLLEAGYGYFVPKEI